MVRLLIYVDDEWKQVDLSSTSSLSLAYTLNNESDLCSFTSPYSTTFQLPLSATNLNLFDFPNIPASSRHHYDYRLYYRNTFIQSGVLIVDTVTSTINCNLFAEQISLNERLSNPDEETEETPTLYDYDKDGTYMNWYGTGTVSRDTKADLSSTSLTTTFRGATASGIDWFMYFMPASIGCPKDFDTEKLWNGTSATSHGQGEIPIFQAPTHVNGTKTYHQLRNYQLQPVLPLMTIFRNVLDKEHNKSDYNITMTKTVTDMLDFIGYTGPKLLDVFDDFNVNINWSATSGPTHTTGTTALVPYDDYFLVKPYLPAPTSCYQGSWAKGAIGAYYTLEVTDGTSTWNILVYPDKNRYGAWSFKEYFPSVTTEFDTYITYENFVNTGVRIETTTSATLTMTMNSYIVAFGPYGISKSRLYYTNTFYAYIGSTWLPYEDDAYQLQVRATGTDKHIFYVGDYLKKIENPWEIVKKVCKKFNIRLKQTGPKDFVLCTTKEYYQVYNSTSQSFTAKIYDLRKYIDSTDQQMSNYQFKCKYIDFSDEPLGTAGLDAYKEAHGVDYGKYRMTLDYPVYSVNDWINDGMKYGMSIFQNYHPFYYPNLTFSVGPIFEACDSDAGEVDIDGCLVSFKGHVTHPFIVFDDFISDEAEQCYYDTSDMSPYTGSFQLMDIPLLLTVNTMYREEFLYGEPLELPERIKGVVGLVDKYFTDVKDSTNARICTTKVLLGKFLLDNRLTVYDFVSSVFTFGNCNWVVNKLDAYNVLSDEPTEVEFLQVMDKENYFPVEYTVVVDNASTDLKVVHYDTEIPAGTTKSFTVLQKGVAFELEASSVSGGVSYFDHWDIDGASYTDNPLYYNVTSNCTIKACDQTSYTWTTVKGTGVTKLDPESGSAPATYTQTIVATLEDGYSLDETCWTCSDPTVTFDAPTGDWTMVQWDMPASNITITCTPKVPHTYTVTAGTGITVSPSSGTVQAGTSVTITATTDLTLKNTDWTSTPAVTFTFTSNYKKATFTMPDSDIAIDVTASAQFSKLYSVYTGFRAPASGESSTMWSTSEGFTIPMLYSVIPVFVETSNGGTVTASSNNSKVIVTKIDDSFFTIKANIGYSDTVPSGVKVTFAVGSVTKQYPVYFKSHHLDAYLIDQDKTWQSIQYLNGAQVVEVPSTTGSYTFKMYSNPCDLHPTASTDYKWSFNPKVGYASDNVTAQAYNYKGSGSLVTATDTNSNSLVDNLTGTDYAGNQYNTDNAFSMSVSHPDSDPDCYEVTVLYDANTTGHRRYFLACLKTSECYAPILIYQNSD